MFTASLAHPLELHGLSAHAAAASSFWYPRMPATQMTACKGLRIAECACLYVMLQKNKAGVEEEEEKKSLLTLLVQNVLRNPYIWGMVSPSLAIKCEIDHL